MFANPAWALYVDITAPASGTVFAAPATIALSADAFPGSYLIPIVKVEFFSGTTLIGTDTTDPYGITWSNVPAGSYTLTAKVTDSDGDTRISDEVIITVNSGVAQIYYIQVDHLNTPRLIADSTGNTVWRWDQSEPFGSAPPNGDPNNTGNVFDLPLRLPGQYYDRETGLHYNYYRDYDPSIGRYAESDLVGLYGGLNTYAYGALNALAYIDPQGLFRGPLSRWVNYGNWGGQNWSGGQYGPQIPPNAAPPVDPMDSCFTDHDRCYSSFENGCLSAADKDKSRKACNEQLIQCLGRLGPDPAYYCAYNPYWCRLVR
ncbi:MAG: RHS repeat-associated core domain-containing protein [Burkholderiales bacterium]